MMEPHTYKRDHPDGVPGKKYSRQPCQPKVAQFRAAVKGPEIRQFTFSGKSTDRKNPCAHSPFELTPEKSALRKYFFRPKDNPAPPGAPPAGGGGREDAGGRTSPTPPLSHLAYLTPTILPPVQAPQDSFQP